MGQFPADNAEAGPAGPCHASIYAWADTHEEMAVQVRIGVTHSPKEIEVDVDVDDDGQSLADDISKALGGNDSVLWLVDRRGRRVGVATDKVSYVEIGSDVGDRRVGFSAL